MVLVQDKLSDEQPKGFIFFHAIEVFSQTIIFGGVPCKNQKNT